ncbi:GrpB family protein [Aeromicrobium terrae]|uniref:GrpB family protein n=1 Tax=Aeromicrobium terrae TaxID=2498846 RepID=A0A5C8NKZ0_9ACTN|nr:GrpB family protein [Aeromicrobium terrae]TXL61820.1 GrpB family protein [Aeromicrobium terrae]
MVDEGVLIGGRQPRDIVIADYDEAWPRRFEAERDRILEALGTRAVRVDHVGSTSVPGLAAKPIVDIDLSVEDVEDEAAYVPDLEAAGYVLRVREPGHRMVRTPELDVHVHVCAAGSEWERRHLLFRDHLRRHPDDRALYEGVKRELATRTWADMNDYADAKDDVVAAIMARAEAWAEETSWSVSSTDG